MKRALIAAGMLVALSGPALADFKEDMAAIGESIKTLTRQRDEAIRDREYWVSRACPIYTSSADSSNGKTHAIVATRRIRTVVEGRK